MIKLRYTMFVVTVLSALALSALMTVPALADDSTPPPTETPTVEAPPIEEVAPLVEETVPAPETITEALASVPEGTDVVVVNADGEILPLGTTEATDIIDSNDPIWCPTGVAPNPGVGGCTTTQNSFNGGLIPLLNNKTANGTIWILGSYQGTISTLGTAIEGGPITLNGGSLGTTANYTLTVKGGWTGATAGTIDVNNPSEFNVPLAIVGWNNLVSLSDILITEASGAGAYGLVVESTKNITLTNVDVQENTTEYGGAYINNTAGATPSNVVINDSTFNGNTGGNAWGLVVYSNGTITTKNLSANGNTMTGAYLDNTYASTAKAVTLTGSNNFKFNGGSGLLVYSLGAITLSNVTAIFNGGYGTYLDNCFYDYAGPWCDNGNIVSAVTVKGTNNFSNNGWDGLRVWSNGAITLQNVTANDNGTDALRPGATNPTDPNYPYTGKYDGTGKGVYLFNWAYPGKAVTLIGTNTFNGNAETGLFIRSYGAVTLNNMTANNNGHSSNSPTSISDGVTVAASRGFQLLGYGIFNDNGDDGLEVSSSFGAVTLNNLYAENNTWWGVGIDSWGTGSAVNVLGTNTFITNGDNGLNIWSEGAVTLSNITANDNNVDGVYVYNAIKWVYDPILDDYVSFLAGKPITLIGINSFNDNAEYGLEMHSSGIITTNNVNASSNGNGVHLDNCLVDDNGTPLDSSDDFCTGLIGKAVTMNGNNNINDNTGDGLWIESLGAIKVNNLTATFNSGNGALLDNNWPTAVGGVTITGFANTSSNDRLGLGIYSRGAVLTSNLTANFNGPASAAENETFYDGVRINNATDPLKLMSVTLLGVNQFNGNWNSGLQISSFGVVVLNNITAKDNGALYDLTNNPTPAGDGVSVYNAGASLPKGVTLNGTNIFNGNLEDGLFIQSLGAIVVNKVTAKYNGLNGAYLDNQFGFVNSALSLLGNSTFTGNGGTNLVVNSNGNVILNNITANDSIGGSGASIDNWSNTITPVTVTLLGVNSFSGNAGNTGLVIYSDGAITLNNVTANDNGGDGAYLNNTDYQIPLKVANITLNGTNTFVGNSLNGLEFSASGNVSLTRITADLNDTGIFGTAAGTITLTCGSLDSNTLYGYYLTAGIGKLITLKGLFTYNNPSGNFSPTLPVKTRTCPLP